MARLCGHDEKHMRPTGPLGRSRLDVRREPVLPSDHQRALGQAVMLIPASALLMVNKY